MRAWLFVLAAVACGAPAKPIVAPKEAKPALPVALDETWQPLAYGAYLAPTDPAIYASGTVDVVFHFHAGRAAEADYRAAGLRAAVVSITVDGFGTTPYWALMDDPNRFERWKSGIAKELSRRAGKPIALGHIALVAWSAGYATVQRILAIPKHAGEVDAVILLDGLHCGYVHNPPNSRHADISILSPVVRFAKDAVARKKLFVFTHSSISTYSDGYASTTEVADALAPELGMTWTTEPRPGPPGAIRSADLGDAHLRGFAGEQAKDHVAHDHFVGAVLRTWLAPRW